MSKSAVYINALIKKYGTTPALDGLNLEIPQGSFFGLLGPNGAGKTTTINILTGLVKKKYWYYWSLWPWYNFRL